jgi:hypothetical protein
VQHLGALSMKGQGVNEMPKFEGIAALPGAALKYAART